MVPTGKKLLILLCIGLYSFSGNSKSRPFECKGNITDSIGGFVVAELFTSEGCSSCPPADALAARLLEKFPENVFVLGFHVDYWDYLGWKDNFSNSAYSHRQQQYANIFHLNSIYTPQLVINGSEEFVGSSQSKLYTAVDQNLSLKQKNTINVSASISGEQINVNYTATDLSKRSKLNFALVQLHAASKVQRGENSGSILKHVNVVRDFVTIPASQINGRLQFSLPADLTKIDLVIIAFAQDDISWKITSASKCYIL